MQIVQLDVTDDQQISEATELVTEQLGGEGWLFQANFHHCILCPAGLWGLVNNAGIWHLSEVEMTPEKIWRQVLEVNLFGMIKVTKAFLPFIRQAKGRVVNMSSVSGELKAISVSSISLTVCRPNCHGRDGGLLRLQARNRGIF